MGILDNLKNVLGNRRKNGADAPTAAPSQVLIEHGIDPSGLQFNFGSDGTLTASGTLARESDRPGTLALLQDLEGIERVEDRMTAAETTADAAGPAAEPAPAGDAEPSLESTTYTVQSGDTLWKIARDHYGDGAQYLKIFEANRNVLEHPDRIFPGQELTLPPREN